MSQKRDAPRVTKVQLERKKRIKNYVFGSLGIVACFGLLLGIIYPLAADTAQKRVIYIAIFASLLFASLCGYWIYLFLRDRHFKNMSDRAYLAKKEKTRKQKTMKKKRREHTR